MSTTPCKIVILGAGVAGLKIALSLDKKLNPMNGEIILIDKNDYHQYLYHLQKVCNKHYDEAEIKIPLSRLLKKSKIKFVKTTVRSIDLMDRRIHTDGGSIRFGILVIALGSDVNFFGVELAEKNSLILDSYSNAKRIRGKIIDLFEDFKKTGMLPKIVIGGAGMTGVELAGEIADWYPYLRRTAHSQMSEKYRVCYAFNEELDFLAEMDSHGLDTDLTKKDITLVELTSGILPGWNERLARKGEDKLRELGVKLSFNDGIEKVSETHVHLASGDKIPYDLFVWSCGIKGKTIAMDGFRVTRGRVVVDEYCLAKGYEDVYVAGDCAHVTDDEGRPQSPSAHIAMEHADVIAHNIVATIKGGKMKSYRFTRIGEIVTIGRTFAMADLFGFKFNGFLATFMKKVVHWWYLHSIGGFGLILRKDELESEKLPDRILEAIPYDEWIPASEIASRLGGETYEVARIISIKLLNADVERKPLRKKQGSPYLYRRLKRLQPVRVSFKR